MTQLPSSCQPSYRHGIVHPPHVSVRKLTDTERHEMAQLAIRDDHRLVAGSLKPVKPKSIKPLF